MLVIPFEWEEVSNTSFAVVRRVKVAGGWLVNTLVTGHGTIQSTSNFVADAKWEWVPVLK